MFDDPRIRTAMRPTPRALFLGAATLLNAACGNDTLSPEEEVETLASVQPPYVLTYLSMAMEVRTIDSLGNASTERRCGPFPGLGPWPLQSYQSSDLQDQDTTHVTPCGTQSQAECDMYRTWFNPGALQLTWDGAQFSVDKWARKLTTLERRRIAASGRISDDGATMGDLGWSGESSWSSLGGPTHAVNFTVSDIPFTGSRDFLGGKWFFFERRFAAGEAGTVAVEELTASVTTEPDARGFGWTLGPTFALRELVSYDPSDMTCERHVMVALGPGPPSGSPPSDATISSALGEVQIVNATTGIIRWIPHRATVADLKAAVIPAAGATFEVYEADAITVATDLDDGHLLVATAAEGATTMTYSLDVRDPLVITIGGGETRTGHLRNFSWPTRETLYFDAVDGGNYTIFARTSGEEGKGRYDVGSDMHVYSSGTLTPGRDRTCDRGPGGDPSDPCPFSASFPFVAVGTGRIFIDAYDPRSNALNGISTLGPTLWFWVRTN